LGPPCLPQVQPGRHRLLLISCLRLLAERCRSAVIPLDRHHYRSGVLVAADLDEAPALYLIEEGAEPAPGIVALNLDQLRHHGSFRGGQ